MKIIWGLVIYFVVILFGNVIKLLIDTKSQSEEDFGYAEGSILTCLCCIIIFMIYSLLKYKAIL